MPVSSSTDIDIDMLIARCKAAGGQDQELDQKVALLLGWHQVGLDRPQWMGARGGEPVDHPPPFSGDLNAVVQAIEQHLPQANCWGVERDPHPIAYVSRNNVSSGHWLREVTANTPYLAFLGAFLTGYRDFGDRAAAV